MTAVDTPIALLYPCLVRRVFSPMLGDRLLDEALDGLARIGSSATLTLSLVF